MQHSTVARGGRQDVVRLSKMISSALKEDDNIKQLCNKNDHRALEESVDYGKVLLPCHLKQSHDYYNQLQKL